MRNIKFLFFTALIITVFSIPGLSLAAKKAATPVAEVSAPEYRFDAVPEGSKITHDFRVRNKGDAPLNVTKVRTG